MIALQAPTKAPTATTPSPSMTSTRVCHYFMLLHQVQCHMLLFPVSGIQCALSIQYISFRSGTRTCWITMLLVHILHKFQYTANCCTIKYRPQPDLPHLYFLQCKVIFLMFIICWCFVALSLTSICKNKLTCTWWLHKQQQQHVYVDYTYSESWCRKWAIIDDVLPGPSGTFSSMLVH
jgi:hypothetical protein